jgi:hypothetical protein
MKPLALINSIAKKLLAKGTVSKVENNKAHRAAAVSIEIFDHQGWKAFAGCSSRLLKDDSIEIGVGVYMENHEANSLLLKCLHPDNFDRPKQKGSMSWQPKATVVVRNTHPDWPASLTKDILCTELELSMKTKLIDEIADFLLNSSKKLLPNYMSSKDLFKSVALLYEENFLWCNYQIEGVYKKIYGNADVYDEWRRRYLARRKNEDLNEYDAYFIDKLDAYCAPA